MSNIVSFSGTGCWLTEWGASIATGGAGLACVVSERRLPGQETLAKLPQHQQTVQFQRTSHRHFRPFPILNIMSKGKGRQPLNHWVMLPVNGPNPINPINGPNPTTFSHKFMKQSGSSRKQIRDWSLQETSWNNYDYLIRLLKKKIPFMRSCSIVYVCGLPSGAFAANYDIIHNCTCIAYVYPVLGLASNLQQPLVSL